MSQYFPKYMSKLPKTFECGCVHIHSKNAENFTFIIPPIPSPIECATSHFCCGHINWKVNESHLTVEQKLHHTKVVQRRSHLNPVSQKRQLQSQHQCLSQTTKQLDRWATLIITQPHKIPNLFRRYMSTTLFWGKLATKSLHVCTPKQTKQEIFLKYVTSQTKPIISQKSTHNKVKSPVLLHRWLSMVTGQNVVKTDWLCYF